MIYPHITVSSNSTLTIINEISNQTLRIYVSTDKNSLGTVAIESSNQQFDVTGLTINTLYYVTAALVVNGVEVDYSTTKERVLMEAINWSPTANIPNWLFFDGNRIYGTRAGGVASRLVYSDDFGTTWNLIKDFGVQIQAFFKTRKGTMVVSSTADSKLYRSTDEGVTWTDSLTFTHQGVELYNWSFAEDYGGNFYAGQYGNVKDAQGNWISVTYLWKTTDDGETWERIDYFVDKTNKHFHVVFVDKYTNRLYVTTGDSIKEMYYSDDQAETWTLVGEQGVQTGFTGLTSHKHAVFCCDDLAPGLNHLYKTTDDVTLEKLYKVPTKFNMQMYSMVSFEDGELWGTCHNEWQEDTKRSAIVRSQDGGQTWEVYASVLGIPSFHSFSYFGYDRWGKADMPYVFVNGGGYGLVRIPRLYSKKTARARKY
ncbi:WD40/YVTN/BNR-like repeat-containing protein [Alkalibacterium sp. MB6]|uniref:WD40/YVTN/BNR-like repeat-containing protein n=1 Tax=Alkalibacterium sp. MB6 TaxID=2081965 RepID=UPI0013798E3D|nr:hypothetical protein [Alkalibacterium sp. MB6]